MKVLNVKNCKELALKRRLGLTCLRKPKATKGYKANGRRRARDAQHKLADRGLDTPGLHKDRLHAFPRAFRALAKYTSVRKRFPIKVLQKNKSHILYLTQFSRQVLWISK
jgi:hypothetical protein